MEKIKIIALFVAVFFTSLALAQDKSCFPESKLSDPEIEKAILNAFNDDPKNEGEVAKRAAIISRDWEVFRDDDTNAPYRQIISYVVYTKKDKCFYEKIRYRSEFDGKEYTKALKANGWWPAKKVTCDCK